MAHSLLVTPEQAVAALLKRGLADSVADGQAMIVDMVQQSRAGAIMTYEYMVGSDNYGDRVVDPKFDRRLLTAQIDFEAGSIRFGDDKPVGYMNLTVMAPRFGLKVSLDRVIEYATALRQVHAAPIAPAKVGRPRGEWREVAAIELASILFSDGWPVTKAELDQRLADFLAESGLAPDERTVARWSREAVAQIVRRCDMPHPWGQGQN